MQIVISLDMRMTDEWMHGMAEKLCVKTQDLKYINRINTKLHSSYPAFTCQIEDTYDEKKREDWILWAFGTICEEWPYSSLKARYWFDGIGYEVGQFNEEREWTKNGLRHRLGGPAVEKEAGSHYFIDGLVFPEFAKIEEEIIATLVAIDDRYIEAVRKLGIFSSEFLENLLILA